MRFKVLAYSLLPLLAQSSVVNGSPHDDRVNKCMRRHEGRPEFNLTSTLNSTSRNVYQTKFSGVEWDEDNWLLTTTNLDQGRYQSRGSVANGYLGINVASVGPFFEQDNPELGDVTSGWPLFSRRQTFATVAGFFDDQPMTNDTNFPWLYQYAGESVISGIPHWSGLILDLGDDTYLDATVDSKTISGFRSTYDYKAGVLSWSYKWIPAGNKGSYKITYRLFTNKVHINQAVVDMEIIPSVNSTATVANVLDGLSAVRTDFVESGEDNGAIFSSVRPWGISNVTAYIYANVTGSDNVDLSSRSLVTDKPYLHANESSIAQSIDVKFSANKPVRITKFVGGASSDAFPKPKQTAKHAASAAMAAGYSKSLLSHITEWANVMPENSVDHFTYPENGTLPSDYHIIDSAITAVVNVYYLLQNTASKNAIKAVSGAPVNVDSISVGGLTSDAYAGQVFWDADVWMQPGLVTSHPEAAQRFTNYRVAKYPQAKANIETAYAGSKNQTDFDSSAAIYPWTSGRYGDCTAAGPCWDYQYHLNGDIGLSMINEWVITGDTKHFREKFFPVYDSVATLYSNLLERNGSSWTLTNMTDPDEYANHVDAGGFTMPLIAQTLTNANAFREQFGYETNETWNEMADNVLIIRENGVTLEFTTMNGTAAVKQADVVLTTFPLDYTDNYTAQNSLNDLDYYANRQSPDGPAMTWAIFSIVANEVSPSGCSAYTYAQYSYDPYVRAPFYQMSEQMLDNPNINGGTHPAYPFLTGHGGANQVVLYGYLGLRLHPDHAIHIDPNLPPQVPFVKYRTFYWRGWPLSASSNYTHTTISRAWDVPPLDTADRRFANVSIPVQVGQEPDITTHHLPVKGPLTIRNRQVGSNNTVPGNIAQCRPVHSSSEFEAGQFPISVVDGAASTKWQPSSASNLSSVTISLSNSERSSKVSGFHFDWAMSPPVNATVIFHNVTLQNPAKALSASSSDDYAVITSLKNIKQSKPYIANSTNLDEIAIRSGNMTTIQLSEPVPAPRFATLLIAGNQALGADAFNGTGATVAEWAILGKGGNSTSPSSAANSNRRLQVKDAISLERVTRRRKFLKPN